ncbi:DDE superfamily endonuclease [Popillia japonica]|uniref:DDE superfamily endonuclease n=1 Tax=Popillia japonica TaxID=7064 RepID=A0AAW1JD36_POPJA
MNVETFSKRLDNFSFEFIAPPSVILIFDGANCHLNITIAEQEEVHLVPLYCLPSNTTHQLQPMEKPVVRAFEAYWDSDQLKYWDKYLTRDLNGGRCSEVLTPT